MWSILATLTDTDTEMASPSRRSIYGLGQDRLLASSTQTQGFVHPR